MNELSRVSQPQALLIDITTFLIITMTPRCTARGTQFPNFDPVLERAKARLFAVRREARAHLLRKYRIFQIKIVGKIQKVRCLGIVTSA